MNMNVRYTPGPWRVAHGHVVAHKATDWGIVCSPGRDFPGEETANSRLIAAVPAMLEALKEAEETLGANLVWIRDRVDLSVRQGDAETLKRLAHLTHGWKTVCAALAKADKEDIP